MSIPVLSKNNPSDQQSQSDETHSLAPAAYSDLVPIPRGGSVSWFKKETFTIKEEVKPGGLLSLTLDVYAYICDARPDDKFEDNKGELYVVIVQRGNINHDHVTTSPLAKSSVSLSLGVSGDVSPERSAMKSILASPKNDSGILNDNYKYILELDESKLMFKDNGNSTFAAHIRARDECSRVEHVQSFDPTQQKWSMHSPPTMVPVSASLNLPPNFPPNFPPHLPPKAIPGFIPFFGISGFSSVHNLQKLRISAGINVDYIDGHSQSFERERVMDLDFTHPPGRE